MFHLAQSRQSANHQFYYGHHGNSECYKVAKANSVTLSKRFMFTKIIIETRG